MISKAELFVAQTHLCLDDPDGPFTMGKPAETADWLCEHIVAATEIEQEGDRPRHILVELDDGSSVAVAFPDESAGAVRIACADDLERDGDWTDEGVSWVLVGDQPGADRYREALNQTILDAPHPVEFLLSGRAQAYERWADAMARALSGKSGQLAKTAAQKMWQTMTTRRQDLRGEQTKRSRKT